MSFTFTDKNLKIASDILLKYPSDRKESALMPLLMLAQKQNSNYLSTEVMDYVANYLNIPNIKVYEVASFYTMYNKKPVGKYHIQVCHNVSCWLRGSDDIIKALESTLKIKRGNTTKDKMFTLSTVECLGACVNAPVMQVNEFYYEDLTKNGVTSLIDEISKGAKLKRSSEINRFIGMPINNMNNNLE